jgi:broad specificity phosphatase PhoE
LLHLTFETHSWSEDNDRGVATGWLPGQLSQRGRALAGELGARRRDASVVFVSDLRRAVETVEIAFAGATTPILADWRLRECDYGRMNGMPAAELHAHRRAHLDQPYQRARVGAPRSPGWERFWMTCRDRWDNDGRAAAC